MTKVKFYDRVDDRKLRFAVIVTRSNGCGSSAGTGSAARWKCPEGIGNQEKIS